MKNKMLNIFHRRSGRVNIHEGSSESGKQAICFEKRFPGVASTARRLAMPVGALFVLAGTLPVSGAAKGWNSLVDGFWNTSTNWTPPGVPGTADDVTLGSVVGTEGTRATLGANASILSLSMINSNDLSTAGFEIIVNGTATLDDLGTTLLVKENNGGADDSFDADVLTVGTDSLVKMLGGRIEVDGSTGSGIFTVNGTLTGYGAIDLDDTVASNSSRFTLTSGTINVGNTSDGIIIVAGDVARTLSVDATDPNTTADLDQGASVLNLMPSSTFDLNVPIVPASDGTYNGTLNLSRKSTLDIEDAWTSGGTINVSTQAGSFLGQSAGPTTITGGKLTQSGGSINLDNATDHLVLTAQFSATGGTLNLDAGTLEFNSGGTVSSTADFQNGSATELILNSNLGVYDADWDWDGNGGSDNIITINDQGSLSAFITDPGADKSWSGLMNINDGDLWVQANDDEWSALGTIVVGGTGQSSISGDRMIKSSGTMTVAAGADLDIDTTAVPAGDSGKLFSGGTVTVNGLLNLASGDFTEWAGSTVNGTGTIMPGTNTVTADQTISVAKYDWDSGNTTIYEGMTLTLDVDRVDTADDVFNTGKAINVRDGATLGVTVAAGAWQLGSDASSGVINLGNAGGSAAVIAAGSDLHVVGNGQINCFGASGRGTISTPLILEEGGVVELQDNNFTLSVTTPLELAGGEVNQSGTDTLLNPNGLLVTGDSAINVATINWDSSSTTVESGGILDLNVTNIDNAVPTNQYDSTLRINGGAVSVDSSAPEWVVDGAVNFYGGGTLSGDAVQFGDNVGSFNASLNVTEVGTAALSAPTTFLSDVDVFIDSGAALRTGTVTFEPVNGAENAEFTGTGTWYMAGTNTVSEITTINMVGGTVDLDNSVSFVSFFANDTYVNADLYINAATLASYGRYSAGFPPTIPASNSELNIADQATLTVNLDDPTAEWTVNSQGIINYAGSLTSNWFIDGSDLNMEGTLNVTGAGYVDARMDISGTVNSLTSGGTFRMTGGNLTDDPNRIIGGTINGPGKVGAASGSALVGFGTVNADVDFDVSSDLLADNGTLVINSDILDARYVGTADADGVLNVVNDWDSSPVTTVRMQGGELQGGNLNISNVNGLTGHGLVTAKVVNNARIVAQGGLLQLTNTASDWDGNGSPELGVLYANTGNLEFVGTSSNYPFDGTIQADAGREVFGNGLVLNFTSNSVINLNGGALRTNRNTTFAGPINAGSGISALRIAGNAVLSAGSTTTLTGNLRLENTSTLVNAGATFAGGGVLINGSGSSLTLPDAYSLAVQLDNEGTLVLGTSPGQVSGTVFTQAPSGVLDIEIAGSNPSQVDSLSLSSSAQLAGTLALSLDGFTPTLGQTFTILTTLSRTGEFTSVTQPPTMPAGLEFDVIYNATNVQVEVVAASASFSDWIDTFASLTDPADKTKTADPDGDGMNNFTEFALDGDPTTGADSGKMVGKIAPVGGQDVLTLTFPVRTGAVETGAAGGELTLVQSTDGVTYNVQSSDDLLAGSLTVTEVTGADAIAIQLGLPALTGGDWEYRSFRSPGPVAGDDREFMRVGISE